MNYVVKCHPKADNTFGTLLTCSSDDDEIIDLDDKLVNVYIYIYKIYIFIFVAHLVCTALTDAIPAYFT